MCCTSIEDLQRRNHSTSSISATIANKVETCSIKYIKFGILTVSDRASRGEYVDQSGPAVAEALLQTQNSASSHWKVAPVSISQPAAEKDCWYLSKIVPDSLSEISAAIRVLCNELGDGVGVSTLIY